MYKYMHLLIDCIFLVFKRLIRLGENVRCVYANIIYYNNDRIIRYVRQYSYLI